MIAVDVSNGEQDLESLAGVADRLFRIELDLFPEPAAAWLHEQCSADWILRVDDDEVVGASLIEQLPELTRARDVVQYWVTRRWLYPDSGRWLDEWPWFPDFQGRLVRNDPQLWFSGLCHSGVALALPARYLDGGLYHLAHLLTDRRERELKVERYRAVDAELRVNAADPHLSRFYVPEAHAAARRAMVDPRDCDVIDAVLAWSEEGASGPVAAPCAPLVGHAEVQARWAARDFGESGYRATITPVDVHRHLVVNDHRPFRVCVRNEGTEWWPGGEDRQPLIRVAYRWLTPESAVLESEGHRTPLPHPLGPGESCLVEMDVTSPSSTGRYLLSPDLVHEHIRWFQSQSPPIEMLVRAADAAS